MAAGDFLPSRTFWAVMGIVVLVAIALLSTMWGSTASEFEANKRAAALRYATNDRVDGVEQRINDTRETIVERFDKIDAKQEKMTDTLTAILRAASK